MLWRTEAVMVSWQKDGYFFWRTRNFKEVYFKDESNETKIWETVQVTIKELDRYVLKWDLVK
jgi:tRNA A37 methylthiotransferase MiaB